MAPPSIKQGRSRFVIWGSLWGGGLAWLLHLLVAWVLAEFGCLTGLAKPGPLDLAWVAWLILAASMLFLLLAGLATWSSWRCGRIGRDEEDSENATAGFISRYGVVANPIFMLFILAQTVPVFFHLQDCGTSILP